MRNTSKRSKENYSSTYNFDPNCKHFPTVHYSKWNSDKFAISTLLVDYLGFFSQKAVLCAESEANSTERVTNKNKSHRCNNNAIQLHKNLVFQKKLIQKLLDQTPGKSKQ